MRCGDSMLSDTGISRQTIRAGYRNIRDMLHTPMSTIAVALSLALVASTAHAQDAYPSRPVRMIVPFAPGGTSDVLARIVAPRLGDVLGQTIVVENRAGASGNIGMEAAARAAPDGYTIFLGNIGTIAINPAIFRSLSADPARDFVAVTLVADVPNSLVVNPRVPANSVAELVAWSRGNPGVLDFASTGSGSLSRLEMEQFRKAAGIEVVHIPYKGGAGPALNGMLGGETHAMFVTLASALGFVQAGKLKALAIASPKRYDALPQVPTMAEAGFAAMVSGSWQGVFAPIGTPRPVVDKLHAALLATLNAAEIRDRLAANGIPVVTSRTPEEFAAFVGAQALRWGAVARDSGAAVD
jgi:tripartite-type tricarboxylate transporter receptor subunit TctC